MMFALSQCATPTVALERFQSFIANINLKKEMIPRFLSNGRFFSIAQYI